jgi:hypothetical protein
MDPDKPNQPFDLYSDDKKPFEITLNFPAEQITNYFTWDLEYTILADRLRPEQGELKVEQVMTPPGPTLGLEKWSDKGLITDLQHLTNSPSFPIYTAHDLEHEFHFWVNYPNLSGQDTDQYDPLWINKVEPTFLNQTHQVAIKPGNPFKLDLKAHTISEHRSLVIGPSGRATDSPGNIAVKVQDYLAPNRENSFNFPFILHSVRADKHKGIVAIDFGTSNSCITLLVPEYDDIAGALIYDSTRYRTTLPLDIYSESNREADIIPTVFHERPTSWYDSIGFGAWNTEGGLREAKRKVSRGVDGEFWQQICSKYIQEALQRAQKYLLQRNIPDIYFHEAVLTVPTTFVPDQKRRLREAARIALCSVNTDGFEPILHDFDESMAVLWYASNEERLQAAREVPIFIVYDFGGGTTDVTVALREVGGNGQITYRPIIPHGDHNLGGHDVNEWLMETMPRDTVSSEEALYNTAELTKRDLGRPEHKVYFDRIWEKLSVRVRAIFEDLFDDLKRQGHTGEIAIALAGGSSNLHNFPDLVYEVVSGLLESKPDWGLHLDRQRIIRLKQPKRSVSIGAYGYFTNPPVTTYLQDYNNQNPYKVLLKLGEMEHIEQLQREKPEHLYVFREEQAGGEMKEYYYYRLIERGGVFPREKIYDLQDLCFPIPCQRMRPECFLQLGAAQPQPITAKYSDLKNVSRIGVRFTDKVVLEITKKA